MLTLFLVILGPSVAPPTVHSPPTPWWEKTTRNVIRARGEEDGPEEGGGTGDRGVSWGEE